MLCKSSGEVNYNDVTFEIGKSSKSNLLEGIKYANWPRYNVEYIEINKKRTTGRENIAVKHSANLKLADLLQFGSSSSSSLG